MNDKEAAVYILRLLVYDVLFQFFSPNISSLGYIELNLDLNYLLENSRRFTQYLVEYSYQLFKKIPNKQNTILSFPIRLCQIENKLNNYVFIFSPKFEIDSSLKKSNNFLCMLQLITVIISLFDNNRSLPIRGLFYSAPKIYKSQLHSNLILNNFCKSLSMSRNSFNFTTLPKGLVIGKFRLIKKNKRGVEIIIDTSKEINGDLQVFSINDSFTKLIDFPIIDNGFLEANNPNESIYELDLCNCLFALIVEKDTYFEVLIQIYKKIQTIISDYVNFNQFEYQIENTNNTDSLYTKLFPTNLNFLIITGRGFPDIATRSLVAYLNNKKLPILGLADSDIYGMEILSLYAFGPRTLSIENLNKKSQLNKYLLNHIKFMTKSLSAEFLVPIGLWIHKQKEIKHEITDPVLKNVETFIFKCTKEIRESNIVKILKENQIILNKQPQNENLIKFLQKKERIFWAKQVELMIKENFNYELESISILNQKEPYFIAGLIILNLAKQKKL